MIVLSTIWAGSLSGEEWIVVVEFVECKWWIVYFGEHSPIEKAAPTITGGYDHVKPTLAKGRASPLTKAKKATFITAERQEVKEREIQLVCRTGC